MLGNVGRPGITLLIPPTTQELRPVDSSQWRMASTTGFNFQPEDHFGQTSLHLSFTDYYVPIHQSGRQTQDSQSHFLESYVSVYDSGQWVGDINILEAFRSYSVKRNPPCNHARDNSGSTSPPSSAGEHIISAESWHDILEPPTEEFVVRANGNWVARVAAVAMLKQTLPEARLSMGNILIHPHRACWQCGGFMGTFQPTRPSMYGAYGVHLPNHARVHIY